MRSKLPVRLRAFRYAILIGMAPGCTDAAALCKFDVIGQGRVAAVIDDTTFRLESGQEIRLAGIEPLASLRRIERNTAGASPRDSNVLGPLTEGREVILRGPSGKPDRYGRLLAFVGIGEAVDSVQTALLDQGQAVASGTIAFGDDKDCTADLLSHEAAARRARKGFWADPAAIKNTERANDILPWIGRFVVAEGKIASVREAGGIVYVNFGRRWTQDFAVTISRRMIRAFEAAGLAPKTLENRIVRVRGWVEQRGSSPRIEALGPGQIELVGNK